MFYQSRVVILVYVSGTLMPLCTHGISGKLGSDTGNSTISNQLVPWSIAVNHIKSICVTSFPLKVYGQMRYIHNTSQGLVTTSFAGNLLYFCMHCLFIWQLWYLLTCDGWYVAYPSNTLHFKESPQDTLSRGVGGNGDIMQRSVF